MNTENAIRDVRYPIGKFERPSYLSAEQRCAGTQSIAELPKNLRHAVDGLYEWQLDTPYREGGWTTRQTIHHLADSHMQAVGRIRLAMTEEWPKITPYQENLWAELPDAITEPVGPSLQLLEGLHQRWTRLLRSLPQPAWVERGYVHPELGNQTLEQIVALYAWHGRHHTAHITTLRERMGW